MTGTQRTGERRIKYIIRNQDVIDNKHKMEVLLGIKQI